MVSCLNRVVALSKYWHKDVLHEQVTLNHWTFADDCIVTNIQNKMATGLKS